MDLLLVRHGVTAQNQSRVFMGWDPVPLAPEGRVQIQRLARRLAGERIDRILASDIARAMESAEILAAAIGKPIEPTPELREIHVGEAVGVAYDEAAARWPGILDKDGEVRFPGGESFADLADRVAAFLRRDVIRPGSERILCVAHGGVVIGAAARLLGRPLRELDAFTLGNASLSVLRCDDHGRVSLLRWNDTAHLGSPSIG